MTIHYNFYAVLVAALVVFVLSVLGSFIYWVNTRESPTTETSRFNRWKWMCVVWLIVFAFMQLAKP